MSPRIYKSNISISDINVAVQGDDLHYLSNVMRVKIGASIVIFNDKTELNCTVHSIDKKSAILNVINAKEAAESLPNIHLLPCIIKGNKMSEIIDAAVQFGVTNITPVISQHCHVNEINIERMGKVANTALEQSCGFKKTAIHKPIKFSDICKISNNGLLIYGDFKTAHTNINQVITTNKEKELFLLVGPEGGLSENELQILSYITHAHGINLSTRVLRAENANIAIMAIVAFLLQNA